MDDAVDTEAVDRNCEGARETVLSADKVEEDVSDESELEVEVGATPIVVKTVGSTSNKVSNYIFRYGVDMRGKLTDKVDEIEASTTRSQRLGLR